MSRRSAGTLALPWSTDRPRAPKRVGMDQILLFVTITLALVGLVMMFSASAVVAGKKFDDSWYYLKRQLVWLTFGLMLLHVISRIDYVWWKRLSFPLLGLVTVLLILVLVPSIGGVKNGARRWLLLGPISIQPAEMAKLISVIYLAAYLARKEDRLQHFSSGLLPPLVIIGILSALVLGEPDLGTVVVLALVTGGLLFVGGARMAHLSTLALCAIPIGLALVLTSEYRRPRLMAFLNPSSDPSNAGHQITQSFLAFGSGGLFGVGLGEGKQKLLFLPEPHTDFVLALVGEELGFVGTGIIILFFAAFVVRGFQISTRARIPFGRYLGIGVTTLIGIQALINACVVTGLLPTKGLTLPFVSYGGSSLVVSLTGVGILLSISRDRQAGREEVRYRSRRGWLGRR
ncbi:MAG: putative peptidoglycan glycosyltransferase FtsW [Candidatus Nitrospira kreftii]|jgi:cell division protein FtsW|uniref:Probable peptidoglycan glycosyltransferase FtsW n=1 Tax=Candidatus Nitrospira kreftii TaxID=2652173 RepID=A0A7S8FGX8_9BACT|nr:MAG: putative peptidoglycan glycosyltransferase FtsW [Candidatus Nitrospira kreftii]